MRSFISRLSSGYVLVEGLPALPFLSTQDFNLVAPFRSLDNVAEGEGFEPPNRLDDCRVSGAVLSASQPTFQNMYKYLFV